MTLPRIAQSSRSNRLWQSALLVSVLVFSLHLSWTVAARADSSVWSRGGDTLSLAESAAATVALGAVTVRKMRHRERGRYGWAFLTLALAANALGDLAWWVIISTQGELPVPSLADPIYLAFYPLFAAGLILLPTAPSTSHERLRLGIDMASALLGGVLLFWVFGIGPLVHSEQVSALELAVTIAYPAGDLALLWALLLLLNRRVSPEDRPALKLLAAGTGAMLLADWFYSWQVLRALYSSGNFLDLGYALMLILFALAAVRELAVEPKADRATRAVVSAHPATVPMVSWSLGLPYGAIFLAFALLVWDHFRPTGVPFPALVVFLGGIIGLLSVRQLLAAQENDALRQSERELTADLLRARNELEARVAERTRELRKVNAALEAEIVEHERAEALLRALLREKEVLLKEVHHRVKNNLQIVNSLFSLQGQAASDAMLTAALLDGQARIKTMSLIHEKLYASPDLARLDFGDYLRALVTHLYRIYRPNAAPIALELDVPATWISVELAVPCGLIVNELVANALKHAFPHGSSGSVRVMLAQVGEGQLRLTVADDGIGMPEGFDLAQSHSLGLQLATMLAKQIDGTIALERGQGTRFEITFPGQVA